MEAISLGIGAISLAIQTCETLVDFCHDWRAKDEEIDQIAQQMIDLDKLLIQLDAPLTRVSAEHVALIDNIKELRSHVDAARVKLENIIKPYQSLSHQAGGINAYLKDALKKAKYSIKKTAIQDVRQVVQELSGNLESAKRTLQLNISCQQLENDRQMIKSMTSLQVSSGEIKSHMHHIETQVGFAGQHVVDLKEEMLPRIENQLVEISSQATIHREQNVELSIGMKAVSRELQETVAFLRATFGEEQRGAIGILPNWKRPLPVAIRDQDVTVVEEEQSVSVLYKPSCTCRKRTRQSTRGISCGPLQLFRRQICQTAHSIDCPMFFQAKQTSFYGIRLRGGGYLFRQTVEMALRLSMGSGHCAIGPMLHVRAIYRPASPAIQILQKIDELDQPLGDAVVDRILQCLKKLFESGKASPYDVNEGGANLLHEAFGIYLYWQDMRSSYELSRIVEFLIEAQVPLMETNIYNYTPVEWLGIQMGSVARYKNIQCALDATTRTSAGGLTLSVGVSDLCTPERWAVLRRFADDFEDLASLGPLSHAVLDRDGERVAALLGQQPEAIHETTCDGQTPVHLACSWPIGLDILLFSGGRPLVNQTDRYRSTVLDYALELDAAESVQLLLASIPAPCFRSWMKQDERLGFAADLVQQALFSESPKATAAAIQYLHSTRDRLYHLARERLPTAVWTSLALPLDRTLDADAYSVYCALLHAGVPIPANLEIGQNYSGIYYCHSLTTEAADLLWTLGFRDINTLNQQGHTPLAHHLLNIDDMTYSYFPFLLWLLSNNVLFNTPLLSTSALPFYLARGYGRHSNHPEAHCDIMPLHLVVQDQCVDDCRCACSANGCTPLLIFLKTVDTYKPYNFYTTLGRLLPKLGCDPHTIIRYITFTALSLTHTCCHIDRLQPRMETEEVDEIHDEEHLLLEELDSLLHHFRIQYQKSTTSFAEFLSGYWKDRMMEVLQGDPKGSYRIQQNDILGEPRIYPPPPTLEHFMDDIMNDKI